MSAAIHQLGAGAVIDHLKKGDLTAVEVASACLRRIESIDAETHCWIHLNPELTLKQAAEVDRKISQGKFAPLSGVPVGIKDIFNTADMPTCMGSPIWEGFRPGNDARVVHALRMADAVLLGKTVTAEFAVHAPGPTRNPHNLEHSPGTSSSGSAAAVAAGMVPIALGTQTAGSIIRPASYCGVYGMKPSFGLLPRTGTLKTTDTLDTVGFFSRNIDDLALALDTLRVRGEDYPISHAVLSNPARQSRTNGQPWRVAFVRGPKWGDAEPYARTALEEFAKTLSRTDGVRVEEVSLPEAFQSAHDIHAMIYDRTLAYYFREEFKNHTLVSGIMYDIITRGNKLTLDDYQRALERQTDLSRKFDDFAAGGYDIVLNLATGGEALKGLDSVDRPDHCLVWTLCGVPAINLPVFAGPKKLPFGAQIVARRYEDIKLLAFAAHLRAGGIVPDGTNPPLP